MKNKFLYLIFAITIYVSCKPTAKISLVPDQADEAAAKIKWSDADLAQLNSGYQIYTSNCGKCHGLHKPTEYDEARWTKIVPWMGKKAVMNEADQKLILHYLLAKREVLMAQHLKPKNSK